MLTGIGRYICIGLVCLIGSCSTSPRAMLGAVSDADAILVAKFIRLEEGSQVPWTKTKFYGIVTVRQKGHILILNQDIITGNRLDDDGLLVMKVPQGKGSTEVNIRCISDAGKRPIEATGPVAIFDYDFSAGKIHILPEVKLHYPSMDGIRPDKIEIDRSGQQNDSIVAEFRTKYGIDFPAAQMKWK